MEAEKADAFVHAVARDWRSAPISPADRALCEFAIDWATRQGYAAMQFNAVAESNVGAVRLYEDLGFTVIGTVPQAYDHARLGRVGLHVMHRFL